MSPDALFKQRPVLLLCSGGDSPGMNPLARAVVRLGLNRHQVPVIGVMDGFVGLVRTVKRMESGEITLEALRQEIAERAGIFGLHARKQHLVLMDHESVSGIVVQGGTKLRSARSKEFLTKERRVQIIQLLRDLPVRAVVVCGGDGSLKGAECLLGESGIQTIGVPGTIDNDLPITDLALGVQSALETLVWSVDHIKDTARSHRRVMVLETMGRDCGELTILAAIASGAEYAVIPEDGFLTNDRIREMAAEMEQSFERGRIHSIVLVSEGVRMDKHSWESPAWIVASKLSHHLSRSAGPYHDIEVRASVLGHIQRGGRPAASDAVLAAEVAEVAWNAIAGSGASGVTALQQGECRLVPYGSPSTCDRVARLRRLHLLQRDLSAW